MFYLSVAPPAPLGLLVARLWLVADGQHARREHIVPSGTVEIVINLGRDRISIDRTMQSARARSYSGAVASGPYSSSFVVDGMQHELMLGAHLRPGAAHSVLGLPANALADAHVDLQAIWGGCAAAALREQLHAKATHEARLRHLQQVLMERLSPRSQIHPVVQFAIDRFTARGPMASVNNVVRETGLSHRRFLTLFTREVGISPKLFCRIQRFQRVHTLAQKIGPIDWAQVAQSCGYFDQSHLANELRKLSGLTPVSYAQSLRRGVETLDGHVVPG
jgi:AraC-like DNA-binding protein